MMTVVPDYQNIVFAGFARIAIKQASTWRFDRGARAGQRPFERRDQPFQPLPGTIFAVHLGRISLVGNLSQRDSTVLGHFVAGLASTRLPPRPTIANVHEQSQPVTELATGSVSDYSGFHKNRCIFNICKA